MLILLRTKILQGAKYADTPNLYTTKYIATEKKVTKYINKGLKISSNKETFDEQEIFV